MLGLCRKVCNMGKDGMGPEILATISRWRIQLANQKATAFPTIASHCDVYSKSSPPDNDTSAVTVIGNLKAPTVL